MRFYFGVKGLISRADAKVLIVRESGTYVEGTELGKWDVVGGRIEPEEPVFAGLRREVAEESGLQIEIGTLLGLTENFIQINSEPCHIVRAYYACQVIGKSDVILSKDHDAYEWIPISTYQNWYLMEDLPKIFEAYQKLARNIDKTLNRYP